MTITFSSGTLRYFRWPYQAKVIKMLETVSRAMVRMMAKPFLSRNGGQHESALKRCATFAIAQFPRLQNYLNHTDALSGLCVYNFLFYPATSRPGVVSCNLTIRFL